VAFSLDIKGSPEPIFSAKEYLLINYFPTIINMSFAASAENVHLGEGGHVLFAQLYDTDGELKNAEIDLNECIGNEDGMLSMVGRRLSDLVQELSSGEVKVRTPFMTFSSRSDHRKTSPAPRQRSPSTSKETPMSRFFALSLKTRRATLRLAILIWPSGSRTTMAHSSLVRCSMPCSIRLTRR
jgi:hypothetical protein